MVRTRGRLARLVVSISVLLIGTTALIVVAVVSVLGQSQQSACDPSGAALPAPPAGQLNAGQIVDYLRRTGMSANAAAGVVGNLVQETGLNPALSDGHGGGGLAQWNAHWYHAQGPHGEQSLDAFARARRLAPDSDDAQLPYLAYDLRIAYRDLLTKLDTAPDPGTAATMFETGYEDCAGVVGFMRVTPGSPCNDPRRRASALAALHQAGGASASSLASLPLGGCAAGASFVPGSGLDPIPGFTPGRDDMGVDACATPGMPIIAPAPSTLVGVVPDWYTDEAGTPQPLLLLHFDHPLRGTLDGDQYWYVAEQIDPVTVQAGTAFAGRQVVARFAGTGSCIEIGWGNPTVGARTLAAVTDPGAAHPPPGALTRWGETFKAYFHIPWMGRSP